MTLPYFSILTLLVALYGAQTMYETSMYHKLDAAQAEQTRLQASVSYFQQVDSFTNQVMRRLAKDSLGDPALSDLLKKYKIKVVVLDPALAPGAEPVPASVEKTNPSSDHLPPMAPGTDNTIPPHP